MQLERIEKEDYKARSVSFEYILPDYEGTIKRVMMSSARVCPNEKVAFGDDITLSGTVEFSMLYQTVEDTLATLSFSVPYDMTLASCEEAKGQIARVRLATFSCLPSGPRRVLAKGELLASVVTVCECDIPSPEEAGDIMTLCERFAFHKHIYSRAEQREYAEPLMSCASNEVGVLYSNATVEISEVRPMKDGAFVSGRCHINALVIEGEGEEHVVSGDIPFEEFLPMGKTLAEDVGLICEGVLMSFSITAQNSEDGCQLVANALISFEAVATECCEEMLPLDIYSTECEIEGVFEKYTLLTECPPVVHKQKLECRMPKSEGDPSVMMSVLLASSSVELVECIPDEGVVYMMIRQKNHMLGYDGVKTPPMETSEDDACEMPEEKKLSYVRQKGEYTHAINLPLKQSKRDMSATVYNLSVSTPEVYEEEDAFVLCVEVSFVIVLSSVREVSLVTSYNRTDRFFHKPKDTFSIAFVDTGATLWQIAKENHAEISALIEENPDLKTVDCSMNSPASLSKVRHLLIP